MGIIVPFVAFSFMAVAGTATNGWSIETPGQSFGAFMNLFESFEIQQGVLNSVQISGGHPSSWNIIWTVGKTNGPTYANNGTFNGIYSNRAFIAVQGPPDKMYGTLAYHPTIDGTANPPIFAPASVTLHRDWSVRCDNPFNSEFPMPYPPLAGAMAFWIGKKPSDLPLANFSFETFGFGRV